VHDQAGTSGFDRSLTNVAKAGYGTSTSVRQLTKRCAERLGCTFMSWRLLLYFCRSSTPLQFTWGPCSPPRTVVCFEQTPIEFRIIHHRETLSHLRVFGSSSSMSHPRPAKLDTSIRMMVFCHEADRLLNFICLTFHTWFVPKNVVSIKYLMKLY
jgi:hypothetical protein